MFLDKHPRVGFWIHLNEFLSSEVPEAPRTI